MESDRMRLMTQEKVLLEEEKAKYPHLFPENTWIDDSAILSSLGIHIPGKNTLPSGFLKLMPSDFIVEEIGLDGTETNIRKEDTAYTDEPGETVYATLVKCGLSTLEAVDELSTLLNTPKDKIQYAGIKDKDAITSQHISIRGASKEKVLSISTPHFFLKDVRTGKGVIQKGGLQGNKFSILVRLGDDISDKSKVEASLGALKKVREAGFYNFFYLQRFGNPRLNNYKWGLSILKGDYEKAVYGLIGDSGLRETPYFVEKREELLELMPDWEKVLSKLAELPLIFSSEIKVVKHLINRPDDYLGALQRAEDQVVLWVSAVASLLYNRKISSHTMAGIEPPYELPLFISPDKSDWLPYIDDLESVGIFPPNFTNLKPFRKISIKHKSIKTKDKAIVHGAEVTEDGMVIEFSLGKGEYATTFLSHFVNLISGHVPEDIPGNVVDLKQLLGQQPITETLEHFTNLNISKKK